MPTSRSRRRADLARRVQWADERLVWLFFGVALRFAAALRLVADLGFVADLGLVGAVGVAAGGRAGAGSLAGVSIDAGAGAGRDIPGMRRPNRPPADSAS